MHVITRKFFSDQLFKLHDFTLEKKLAVAVSGGGDSMALGFLLSEFASRHQIQLHILIVDHGLRDNSAVEAKQVRNWIKDWSHTTVKILNWTGDKPKTKIQEQARAARYSLMANYCRTHKIGYLFLAHHGDDQAETFLFRLAKGSGLDGLSVMSPLQRMDKLTLVRPLLDVTHRDLIDVCETNKLPWIEDPSNSSEQYARVRLRQSRAILEREGLTVDKTLKLAKRLSRARSSLEQITDKAFEFCLVQVATERIEIDLQKFVEQPQEIGLRILQKAISLIGKSRSYPPSLQIFEDIAEKIYETNNFRAATLAGCIIRRRKRLNLLEIVIE